MFVRFWMALFVCGIAKNLFAGVSRQLDKDGLVLKT